MPRRTKFQFGPPPPSAPQPDLLDVKLVWVQCNGYRCMAYCDARGRWVNFYTGKVLTDFVEVIE